MEYKLKQLFGITFYHRVSPKGEVLRIARLKELPRDQAEEMYLYTKGKYIATRENDPGNTFYSERLPGLCSKDFPPEPRGIYRKVAVEDSEWWCCNYSDLRKSGYEVDKVVIASGTEYNLEANVKYAMFSGQFSVMNTEYNGPVEVLVKEPSKLFAKTDTYGYVLVSNGE